MEAGILSRQIENAQKKVEEQNFVARKNVLKYDDVMNVQRQVIYEQRRSVLDGQDLSDEIKEEWLPGVVESVVGQYTDAESPDDWDLGGLVSGMEALYGTGVAAEELQGLDFNAIVEEFVDDALDAYREREAHFDGIQPGLMRDLERYIVLQTVDTRWREHLENMDYLREGIFLRGLVQKDPLVEYRNEGHEMFQELNGVIREEVISLLFHAQVAVESADGRDGPLPGPDAPSGGPNGNLNYEHQSVAGADAILAAGGAQAAMTGGMTGATAAGPVAAPAAPQPVVKSEQESIGRNDPCWCGSGKKYKRCHGA
jgi:preprotein translocase subunit SecA